MEKKNVSINRKLEIRRLSECFTFYIYFFLEFFLLLLFFEIPIAFWIVIYEKSRDEFIGAILFEKTIVIFYVFSFECFYEVRSSPYIIWYP